MDKPDPAAVRAQALRAEADSLARAIDHLAAHALNALKENP